MENRLSTEVKKEHTALVGEVVRKISDGLAQRPGHGVAQIQIAQDVH